MGLDRKYYARTTQFKEINRFCNHLVHPPLWKKQYGETMTSWILLSPAVRIVKCGCFNLLYIAHRESHHGFFVTENNDGPKEQSNFQSNFQIF